MQVASEQIVTAAAAPGAPAVHALPLRKEGPDLAAIVSAGRPGWMRDALCREYPNIDFLGESKRAKRICTRCLALKECRAYALDNAEVDGPDCTSGGIWGGLSASDRRRLRAGGVTKAPPDGEARGDDPMTRPVDHLTTAEVADLFGVSTKAVARWANQERLPYTRNDWGTRYFPRDQVEALRAQMSHGGG